MPPLVKSQKPSMRPMKSAFGWIPESMIAAVMPVAPVGNDGSSDARCGSPSVSRSVFRVVGGINAAKPSSTAPLVSDVVPTA